jgi:hypothetical protein
MAVNEALVFDGLAVNDEVNFALEVLGFTPAKKQAQFIDNPDADGGALAYEPNYTNSEFLLKVRIVPQATMDTALTKWGELQAKLQKASRYRDKGGIPLVWTPAGSTRSYTFYVLLGEISELPITVEGDLAGWFISSPVIQVKLTCRPFGYLAERTILAEKANATPLQEITLEGVGGDVPAEGRLIVTEKAATDRRHLEWGLDQLARSALTNLVPNPSGEVDAVGYVLNKASWAEGEVKQEANPSFYSGEYALRVKAKKDATATLRTLSLLQSTAVGSITPGQPYCFSAPIDVVDNISSGLSVRIDWYTAALAYISSSATSASYLSTGETRLSVANQIAPATASVATVVLQGTSATSGDTVDFWTDGWQLEQGTTVSAYMDGDSPDAGWTGGRGASASVHPATGLILAASMITAGFSGSSTTRAGAYSSSKVIRASAVTLPTVVCGTGDISHVGSYRVKGRVYPTSEAARFRISYRVGDGPFKALPWVAAPGVNNFYEVDLGEITLEEVELGIQRSEIRVEHMSVGSVHQNDANYLELIPTTSGYGKARAPQFYEAPTALVGSDAFEQVGGGTLAGKVAPIGGAWSEAGDPGGFTLDSTNHYVTRTEVSDAEGTGHVGLLGPEYTDIAVGADLYIPADPGGGFGQYGVVARYSSITKGLYAFVTAYSGEPNKWHLATGGKSGNIFAEGKTPYQVYGQWIKLRLVALSNGNWQFWLNEKLLASGFDSRLVSGGELGQGKVGIYDQHVQPSANTRYFDNFASFVPTTTAVCRSGKEMEVRSDETLRQDTTGNYWGAPPSSRGSRFFVPVGSSRLAAKMRRNDVDTEVDSSVTDNQGVEVTIAERFLAPR